MYELRNDDGVKMCPCQYLLFSINSSLINGVYTLRNNDSLEEYQVYCHMTEISGCGSGGWTLVMKMGGNKVKIILYRNNLREKNTL